MQVYLFFSFPLVQMDNSNLLFLNFRKNITFSKVNMHQLILSREKIYLYMDTDWQQHKLHMQAFYLVHLMKQKGIN